MGGDTDEVACCRGRKVRRLCFFELGFYRIRRANSGQHQARFEVVAVEDNHLVSFVVKGECRFEFWRTPAGLFGQELGLDLQPQSIDRLALMWERLGQRLLIRWFWRRLAFDL